MKKSMIYIMIFTIVGVVLSDISSVEAENWRKPYINALERGKIIIPSDIDEKLRDKTAEKSAVSGLAYTPPSEDVILEKAITQALTRNAPPCECMKIAINLQYNPYSVLKNIYGAGNREILLDQLCMCASELGIMKAVIARAATDALSSSNEPIFQMDEISQCQCLGGEEGFAYTPAGETSLRSISMNLILSTNNASASTP